MSALRRQPELPLRSTDWQPDVTQLLDESHLAAWSEIPRRRLQFTVSLQAFLSRQRDTEVCVFYGHEIRDLETFCCQLERALPGPQLVRRIEGPGGITSLLRSRPVTAVRTASKYRYYVWHDADTLLRSDRLLFGRLVDTFAGVAAEAEYASDDLLLIHRAIFVGSAMLEMYAEDPTSQFNTWASDDFGEPFWHVVTGVERPPILRYCIDELWK